MRILWFTPSPSLGGEYLNVSTVGCSWIQSLETGLKKVEDIQLGITYTWYGDHHEPFVFNGTSYYSVKIKETKGKIRQVYSRWLHQVVSEENLNEYIDIIEDFAPDIIHIFGTESDYGLLASRVSIPCIIHIQGSLIAIHNKWFSGLTKSEVFKYSKKWPLLKGHGLLHEYFLNKKMAERERQIFQNGHFFVGRTDWDRRLSSVLSPKAEYFHCDEIMRERFYLHRWQLHLERNEYVLITTIRRNIYKGLETVYECKKILNQQFPSFNFIWKIAGVSETEEIVCLIEKKYKSKFKNANIKLLGGISEDDLINEMLGADLYIHPSHIENSSNSICEAMLIGMPIIATFAGGTSSILEDKEEGLLIQDGDPYSLAGAIIELIRDRKYANNLGRNARAKAIVRHNPDKIVESMLDIYTTVMQKKKNSLKINYSESL